MYPRPATSSTIEATASPDITAAIAKSKVSYASTLSSPNKLTANS
jgi:hypothetical protein